MKKIIIILSSFLVACLFFSFKPAYAAVTIPAGLHPTNAPTITGGPAAGETPEAFTEYRGGQVEGMRILFTAKIINVLFGLAGVVAIFFIIQNGFFLSMSGGSEEIVTQHKKGLMWAVMGLILVILSYSIVRFVISIPMSSDEKLNPAPPAPAAAPAAPAEEPPSDAEASDTGMTSFGPNGMVTGCQGEGGRDNDCPPTP